MIKVSREDFTCAAATNASAYRRVTIPVLKIEAGPGPAVALMAGVPVSYTHLDVYKRQPHTA